MSVTGAYSTQALDGGNHEQSLEVHDKLDWTRVLASTANVSALMCEQASPNPAIHVQCAQITMPPSSAANQV